MEFEQTINSTCNSIYRSNRTNSIKNFFYTYEYTLDLIFKEFAGYFTILIVVNLIFKTEESWKFEEKKMCGRFFGKVMFWSGVWKSEIMVGRPEIWPDRLKLQSKSRKFTKRFEYRLKRPKTTKIHTKATKIAPNRNKSTQKRHKSIQKPKVDGTAKNWPNG